MADRSLTPDELVLHRLINRTRTTRDLLGELERLSPEQRALAKKSLSVITERKTSGVWYVPGGQSTIGQMLKDARAHYAFADDHQAGSLSLSFETVLDRAGQSDVWLFKYNGHPATLQELAAEYAGYRQFKAFRTHNVYACDCTRKPYFEQVSFHPDRLLSDIIQIVHPDIAGFAPMQYYERLK